VLPSRFGGRLPRCSNALRILALICLALTLTGCLNTRFIYNQLDWFITWQIGKYFDLEKEQKVQLRDTVSRSLNWVRTEQLPDYANILRAIAAEAGTGELTVSRWEDIYEQMIALFDEFLNYVIPDAVAFLSTLSDDQVEYLMDKLGEENQELRDEYSGSTPEERQKRREKAIVKNMQRFTGRLNADQKAAVSSAVASMYDNSEEWLEGRRLWQQAFRELLLERPPREEFEARLLAISIDPNYVDTPEYRAQVEANQRIVLELLANLIVSLDDKQRQRFQRRMNGFADDFDALALEANGQSPDSESPATAWLSPAG
jgi:FMN phosphatase YigB (HAD superfamily)